MYYRCMEMSDYDSIVALWQNVEGVCLREADSRTGISSYLKRNPGLSFVAVSDAEVVGTILSGHDGRRGYIQHLAVSVSYQRQGIGSRLLKLCLEGLLSQGIMKSHIHVLRTNESGRIFWEANGWFERLDISLYSFINAGQSNA